MQRTDKDESSPVDKNVEATPPIANWFMILIAGAILIFGLWVGRDFLIPLAITGLVFILSTAIVDWISRRSIAGFSPPRWLANLIAASIVVVVLFLLGGVFSEAAKEIAESGGELRLRASVVAGNLEGIIGSRIVDAIKSAVANLDIGAWLEVALIQIASGVSSLALVTLYLAFLISEHKAWIKKLPLLASSPESADRSRVMLDRISRGVQQYMLVNAVTSALSGMVAYIIFRSIGLDFAALLAVIVFIAGFIPNIGAFIGISLPCLMALIQFDTLTPFFIVLLGYGAFDQFVSNILQPAMQGKSLNISTFMVMVSLTFWGALWGGIGVFLAVPMMVVAMVICSEIPLMRWLAVLLSSDGVLENDDKKPDAGAT